MSNKVFYENFDPNDKNQLVSRPESPFVTKLPDKLILKLVKFSKDRTYLLMDYFNHKVGNSDRDTRNHVCLKSLGEKESPEKSAYFDARKRLKELKADNAPATEIAKAEMLVKTFKFTTRGWLCGYEPNSPKLKAYRVPQSVLDDIFGVSDKQATEHRPARKGLLDEMLVDGRSPFNAMSEEGWIQITKNGQGINTRYKVTEYAVQKTEKQGNKTVTYTEIAKASVHPAILEITWSDIPNPVEFEKRFAFTLEEAKAFVESRGTVVPERLINGNSGRPTGSSQPQAASVAQDESEEEFSPVSGISEASFASSNDDVDELPF